MFLKDKLRLVLAIDSLNSDDSQAKISFVGLRRIFKSQKSTSLRSILSRLVSSGQVERLETPSDRFYRLTSLGIKRLLADFYVLRMVSGQIEQDQYLLIFSFPERDRFLRDKLRLMIKKEKWLPLATSVYFSSHQPSLFLRDSLKNKKWLANILLIKADEVMEGNLADLLKKKVNFDKIYAGYLSFISQADGVIGLIGKENSPIHWQNISRETINLFFEVLGQDPGWPESLWQPENLFLKAWRRFGTLIKALSE